MSNVHFPVALNDSSLTAICFKHVYPIILPFISQVISLSYYIVTCKACQCYNLMTWLHTCISICNWTHLRPFSAEEPMFLCHWERHISEAFPHSFRVSEKHSTLKSHRRTTSSRGNYCSVWSIIYPTMTVSTVALNLSVQALDLSFQV